MKHVILLASKGKKSLIRKDLIYFGMKKTSEERMRELEIKIEQLKEQKKALLAREKEKERKQRTRRLIQNGALAEQYLLCENISPEEFELLLKKIVIIEQVKEIINP